MTHRNSAPRLVTGTPNPRRRTTCPFVESDGRRRSSPIRPSGHRRPARPMAGPELRDASALRRGRPGPRRGRDGAETRLKRGRERAAAGPRPGPTEQAGHRVPTGRHGADPTSLDHPRRAARVAAAAPRPASAHPDSAPVPIARPSGPALDPESEKRGVPAGYARRVAGHGRIGAARATRRTAIATPSRTTRAAPNTTSAATRARGRSNSPRSRTPTGARPPTLGPARIRPPPSPSLRPRPPSIRSSAHPSIRPSARRSTRPHQEHDETTPGTSLPRPPNRPGHHDVVRPSRR